MGTISAKMTPGTKIIHPTLGEGIILELRKYQMALVDFSTDKGVMVRKIRLQDVKVKNEEI